MNLKTMKSLTKQFIKFGLIGILNTVLSLLVYYILMFFGVYYLIANSVAFIVSVLNAYWLNRVFVFKSSMGILKTLIKTYAAYLITYVTGIITLYILVDILGISEYIAPLIIIGINAPVNFVLNRNWSMK